MPNVVAEMYAREHTQRCMPGHSQACRHARWSPIILQHCLHKVVGLGQSDVWRLQAVAHDVVHAVSEGLRARASSLPSADDLDWKSDVRPLAVIVALCANYISEAAALDIKTSFPGWTAEAAFVRALSGSRRHARLVAAYLAEQWSTLAQDAAASGDRNRAHTVKRCSKLAGMTNQHAHDLVRECPREAALSLLRTSLQQLRSIQAARQTAASAARPKQQSAKKATASASVSTYVCSACRRCACAWLLPVHL